MRLGTKQETSSSPVSLSAAKEQKEGKRQYSPKVVFQLWAPVHLSRQYVNCIIKS